MPAVWYIGQAAKRTVGVEDWADFGIVNRPAVTWEQENGWSIPHVQLTEAQQALLNNDPLFVVGAPDGPRTGMPAGVDAGDFPTKGWVVEQVVQRLGERGSVADEDDVVPGNPEADVPVGGEPGHVLTKLGGEDYDVGWRPPATSGGGGGGSADWPAGGTTGQYLGKNSSATGDVGWKTLPAAGIGNVMFAIGDSSAARPTTRTDIMVIFATVGTTPPANMVPNLDIWMQRP